MDGLVFRRLAAADSFAEMTALLHLAYAPLAAAGMHFYASHQSIEHTEKRAGEGECFVVTRGDRMVATITLRMGATLDDESTTKTYRDPRVVIFGQFGVHPDHKGCGIGRRLLDLVEERAVEMGAHTIACDTAETAHELIALYRRRGYAQVEAVQWDGVNYRSVILAKRLRD